ncbi:ABC transporter permease subunit [Marinilactibacillus sp. XAAS-LB27]|uniref:ABC transporter permease n=1 Tax=Marinilactibacillus sp. XAAS-LB27 TaxID=3114538 RepID=UPI002E180F9F|nr:ABC transporter permease subunit [Marinilactibacillus sp. XAAS-LB27]
MANLPKERNKYIVSGILTSIADMIKMLNPRRFYFAVGKKRFIEFIIFSIFLLIFYGPLMNTFMLAFANVYQFPDVIPREFGLQWWDFILSQQNLIDSIFNSFLIAFLSTSLSLIICLPAAYALARFDFKGKKIIMFSFLFSNAFPKIGLYTSIGILFYRLNLMGTFQGVLIIHLINTLMFMVWLPAGAFRSVHRQQEEAARDVGAGPFRTFTKVTLPLAAPGIAIASIYTFLGSLDEAQGTLLVGFPKIQTMATSMYGIIFSYPPAAGAVFALILMIPSAVVLFLFRKYIGPKALSKGIKIN